MRSPVAILLLVETLFVAGCASPRSLPQPLLDASSPALASQDSNAAAEVRACRHLVLEAAPVTMQPRWLPPITAPDGVVVATAVKPQPIRVSPSVYRQHMERCLSARGYEVRGWE